MATGHISIIKHILKVLTEFQDFAFSIGFTTTNFERLLSVVLNSGNLMQASNVLLMTAKHYICLW